MRAIKWTSILGEKGNRFFDIRSGGSATTLPAFKVSIKKKGLGITQDPFLKLVRWRDSTNNDNYMILIHIKITNLT